MSSRLLLKVGKSRRQEVLQTLKRAGCGMTVSELAKQMRMSYMGAKEICLDLQKSGYLSPWRKPSQRGRPEILYRLTRKAAELFPKADNGPLLVVLESASRLFGSASPGKLLLAYYQETAKAGAAKVRGETIEERMKWLSRWRDGQGHYASIEAGSPPVLVERHHPMLDILETYPEAIPMEETMISNLLGCPVRREETRSEGSIEWRFVPQV